MVVNIVVNNTGNNTVNNIAIVVNTIAVVNYCTLFPLKLSPKT